MSDSEKKKKVNEILKRLYKVYPHPKTALRYKSPWELLAATILSAQATDKLVNQITPELFKKYKTVSDFAKAPIEEIDAAVKRINFHRNKAKSIHNAAIMLLEKYKGRVPETIEELDELPGVARKTANVVLGNAFGKNEGVVVDTHVIRLSKRLGLTNQKTPEKIEQDLMKIIPKEKWTDFSNLIVQYGRDYCPARSHVCSNCPLGDLCPDIAN